ncbi:MAG: hypothetical protein Q8Q42_00260 [Nanoarchaeota archaeon]|nr:hypothetical protein [Nanoarchaeota archaeon]
MKTILVDAWNTFVTEDGIFLKMEVLLDGYDNKKIIVTNANEEEKLKYGIVNMPYEVFTLSHNPNKTNPEYFKNLLKKYSLLQDEVIYFDHNSEAVKTAESLGITSFWYDKDKKDLESLKKFLDDNL